MLPATTEQEINVLVENHPAGNLWQTPSWGQYQAAVFGRTYRFFGERDHHGKLVSGALVVEHSLRWGYHYWYLPRGPLLAGDPVVDLALLQHIWQEAKQAGAIFVQLDPRWAADDPHWTWLDQTFGSQQWHTPQPQTTLRLDLRLAPAELLSQMKEKGRYNIRLSERKGVTVRRGTVAEFYHLLQETHQRDGFAVHALDKYQGMIDCLAGVAEVLVAEYLAQPIAAGIFCFTPREAIYYYGASGNQHRNLMAPYLLQWRAIEMAQERGCLAYDFLGIAPRSATANHPWAGVTEFKTKFGGQVLDFGAPRLIPIHRPLTWIYRLLRRG